MITTVTFNTAVDKAYLVDEINTGQVVRVKSCTNTPGGKGLNVAKVVKLCGEEVTATGFLGGHSGAYIEEMLDEQQVCHRFIHIEGETRSCINILEPGGRSTEFLEPGIPVSQEDCQRFLEEFDQIVLESDVITISGSLPKGMQDGIYGELIRRSKAAGKRVILDTSGVPLEQGLMAGPAMIKPNADELKDLLGIPALKLEDVIAGTQSLRDRGPEVVVVSLGSKGAVMATENGTYFGKPPLISAVNTVGCGDSMTAALAVGLCRGYAIQEILRYSVAISAANALSLRTGYFRQEDLNDILPRVIVDMV